MRARQDSLEIFAAPLTRARLLVANDGAALHFATALGAPVLYFAQREKLVSSHPRSASCWALYDDLDNDPHRISSEAALGTVREMVRRGVVHVDCGGGRRETGRPPPARGPPLRTGF